MTQAKDLSERCVREFGDKADWRRGKDYFQRGAVSILFSQAEGLNALVQGSGASPYLVRLDWSDAAQGTLLVYCSCPRFDDMGMCKHVAATILAADKQGMGQVVRGRGILYPEPMDNGEAPGSSRHKVGRSDPYDPDPYDLDERDFDFDLVAESLAADPATLTSTVKRDSRARPPRASVWKKQLSLLAELSTSEPVRPSSASGRPWSKPREIWYLLDVPRTLKRGWPCVSLWQRPIKKDGTPGKLKAAKLSRDEVLNLPCEEDRTLIGLLAGNERESEYGYNYASYASFIKLCDFAVAPAMFDVLLPRLCASERFGWLPDDGPGGDDQVRLLSWDDGPAWKVRLHVAESTDGKHWQLDGRLERDNSVEPLGRPLVLLAVGLVIFSDRIARLDTGDDFRWVVLLRESGPVLVPKKDAQSFVEQMVQLPYCPPVEWPDALRWEEERPAPVPQLRISKSKRSWESDLECRLTFRYGERTAPFGGELAAWYDRQTRLAVLRDFLAEQAAAEQLLSTGAKQGQRYYGPGDPDQFFIAPAKMVPLVQQLTAAGWQVEAEGRLIRPAGRLSLSVTSGVDWFDLEGACDFGGVEASLPRLLAALRKGEKYVQLDDGSQGMLPEQWLARYGPLADLGQTEGDQLRFLPSQAALLDALLAAQENGHVTVDRTFARLRDKLRSFEGIPPRKEPRSFVGELRQYQREGLGWLRFLDEFGFGGCLADDMGLGKTIQILARLEERRRTRTPAVRSRKKAPRAAEDSKANPSLVVVPRSLVFNWIEEAGRFTPKLRVLNYTGLDRHDALPRLNDHDLVVTTYGTLRRDIIKLRDYEFDYAILDEAQAIKNASSQAAKACRLLRARRRLAMTGTPVENHVGELWSLFEYLNPGMLGRHKKLNEWFAVARRGRRQNSDAENGNEPAEELAMLARAIRPFLLRRTKQQVLTELPAKTEQTLYCELGGPERALYDELRQHYRRTLSDRVSKVGVNKSKIHVLEALLRLRQAACHPGLLDKKKSAASSSKLETLIEQLTEVIDEGHKALVFSQFTSLLAIVRGQLDQRGMVYEYLDGRTVHRQAKVERFQTDPACRLFLISLKAGGQGLNLTAADYVFILDPWWNPAVEAQAVDRAHRIGQDRHVFAYRIIARDTVEEKILLLQNEKRELAEAIVSADKHLLRDLTAEDLQLLLS